ncbi:MAG: response regulator [Deltaproteobacteria bacterium]|nr:MAG: response regulator [Deltaproteobacteria bacterium]
MRNGKKHVLVADDEKHTRFTLSLIFRKAGFRVTTVADGLEALKQTVETIRNSDPFDLLVLDIQMPGLTGIELIDEIENLSGYFPIVLITGYWDREIANELKKRCCIEYAEKPFEPGELFVYVGRVLERFIQEGARRTEEGTSAVSPNGTDA